MTQQLEGEKFSERTIRFSNGLTGTPIHVPTANPRNFYEAIASSTQAERLKIEGQLFLPESANELPVVIVVPGSLGVADSHLSHAETLTTLGFAACVIDPFGAREVTSTVANQTQYSFAASAWDILATVEFLAEHEAIDSSRIGAQGHSRGGSAVMTAASQQFSKVFSYAPLAAVYAAYPWCGQQFSDPSIGATQVRAIIGDRDEWCSPQQVQGHIQAMRVSGGDASIRIVAGAQHSFDRSTPVALVAEASVSPGAPTSYLAADGAFIDPLTNIADPALTDRDLMIYGMKAGYGRKGAQIGSSGDQAEVFRDDMVSYWRECFL